MTGASRAAYSMNVLASRCESPRTGGPYPLSSAAITRPQPSCVRIRDGAGWSDRDHSWAEVPSDPLAPLRGVRVPNHYTNR